VRRLRDDQAGFTLVELLVVTVLLGVIGAIAVQGIVITMERQRATAQRIEGLHELEIAVQRASRDLRAANPLVLSETRPATTMIGARIQREAETLIVSYGLEEEGGEQVLVQRTAVEGETVQVRQLVTQVDNDDAPVFRYLREDGTEIECDDTVSTCARTFMDQATDVEINLLRGVVGQDPVTVSTTINIRNIRYGS
jgi:prepilin-type N-terminal cleavage/methylation domain-containing protein